MGALALLFAQIGAAQAADAHASFDKLVTANGVAVAVFNGGNSGGAVLDQLSDHLYKQPDAASEETRDLLYDAYFGLRAEGVGGWAREADSYGYLPDSNIIAVDRSAGGLGATEYLFAPMDLAAPALVALFRVENATAAEIGDVQVFSLGNFHVGTDGGDGFHDDNEAIWVEDEALVEWGNATGLVMQSIPLVSPSTWSCDAAWATVNGGGDLDGRCGTAADPWTWDDQTGALQWDLGALAPGEARWVGVVYAFSSGYDVASMPAEVAAWRAGREPEALLEDAVAGWLDWLEAGHSPGELSEEEAAVYRAALVFLKAGQVVEPGAPYGQIPASYPVSAPVGGFTHTWNIAWVRDGAYAIRALAEAGYEAEAGAALDFLMQEGKSGSYRDYLGGLDYAVSVCRVYGDGTEWSDDDGSGPNIELDNFGLFLWAAEGAWRAGLGDDWLAARADRLFGGVADVLVALVEPDGEAAGLLIADSSIWERHWNGNQKHFTYSALWAAVGLDAAADMADALGESGRAATYAETAAVIRAAIARRLVDGDGVLQGNLEEMADGDALDLAAVEALNTGVIEAGGAVGLASLAAWDEALSVASGHGYFRNDDGDLYDRAEWLMIDLRVAEAKRRACDNAGAEAIEAWVTDQAALNFNIIPELMDPDSADYAGPAPMLGFGSGAFVLNVLHREDAAVDCAEGGDEGGGDAGGDDGGGEGGDGGGGEGGDGLGDDTGPPDPGPGDTGASSRKTGCACQAGGARGGAWLGLALLGAALRRRGFSAAPAAAPRRPSRCR